MILPTCTIRPPSKLGSYLNFNLRLEPKFSFKLFLMLSNSEVDNSFAAVSFAVISPLFE